MPNRSTVPAVKAALQTALQARANLSTVNVVWGTPSGALSRDTIMLGDVTHNERTRTTDRQRREEYDLYIGIHCLAAGTDQATLTKHAYDIAGEIEDYIYGDRTIAGSVTSSGGGWAEIIAMNLSEPSTNTAMEARINMTLHVVSLI